MYNHCRYQCQRILLAKQRQYQHFAADQPLHNTQYTLRNMYVYVYVNCVWWPFVTWSWPWTEFSMTDELSQFLPLTLGILRKYVGPNLRCKLNVGKATESLMWYIAVLKLNAISGRDIIFTPSAVPVNPREKVAKRLKSG